MKDKKKLGIATAAVVGTVFVSGCADIKQILDTLIMIFTLLASVTSGLTPEQGNAIMLSASDLQTNADLLNAECSDLPVAAYTRMFIEKDGQRVAYWVDSNNKVACIATGVNNYKDRIISVASDRKIGSAPIDVRGIHERADKSFFKDTADSLQWLKSNINNIGLNEEQKSIIRSQDVRFRAEDAGAEIKLTFESSGKTVVLWADKATHKITSVGEKVGQVVARPVQGPIVAASATA